MPEYFACGKQNKRFIPACEKCFEIWGDLFPNNAGIECDLDDIDTSLEDEDIGNNGEFIIQTIKTPAILHD